MKRHAISAEKIVDLLRYKGTRTQGRLDFEAVERPQPPSLALVTPFRPLSARDVSHRERMLKHLGTAQPRNH